MTVRLNHGQNQAFILQQLKAAQNRVATLTQEVQQTNPQEQSRTKETQNNQQQTQQSGKEFDALNHAAAMNVYGNNNLSSTQKEQALSHLQPKADKDSKQGELREAKTEVTQHQKSLSGIQQNPATQNPQLEALKDNPIFEKLPAEIKNRPDAAQLVQNVEQEALLSPESAVQALVDAALQGDKKAYMKLDEYAKNPYEKLQQNAQKGMEKVVSGAEGRPKVLEMIAGTSTEKAQEASAKLLNLANRNPRAQQGIERLVRKGAVNFTKTAQMAKDQDPGNAAQSINTMLIRGNLSKADRKGAVGILGQIATESPTGAGSKDAAKGLTRAVKSEPLDVAKTAAVQLKEATMSGNSHALNGLQMLSKCDDPSRAALALTQLGEVAQSGTSNSVEALQSIKSVAEAPDTNGKLRNQAVELLGNVAQSGGANGKEAVETVSNIATNKSNPANATAFNTIGKLNDATLGVNPSKQGRNVKKQGNLSDTETYKKIMATQQQIQTQSQQPLSFFNKLGMQFMSA